MNCKTCKHWQPLPNESPCCCGPDGGPGEPCYCRIRVDTKQGCYVPWAPNSGVCGKAAMAHDKADPFDEALMFVQDGSDYRACLVTKAEFFCAHFEAKP